MKKQISQKRLLFKSIDATTLKMTGATNRLPEKY